MSATDQREQSVGERLGDRPRFSARRVREAKPRDLLVRFAAGATTSIVSGLVTLAFGPRVGGILLAFPAILAASLTLIEEQEDSQEAREDARGAIAGACALTAFAVIAALTFGHLAGGVVLLVATVGWAITALALYVAFWWR
jgi:hypothetical protein